MAFRGGLVVAPTLREGEAVMDTHSIKPIDLVVVNLYPFAQTVAKAGCTLEDAVENIFKLFLKV